MKKTILTVAVVAFLMGGFCNTVSAMETNRMAKSEIVAGNDWDKVLDEYEKYVQYDHDISPLHIIAYTHLFT